MMKYSFLIILGIFVFTTSRSQESEASKYDPRDLFPANSIIPSGNSYRSATGEPGEAYWQNRVDYTIDATLDDIQNRVVGIETISYTNNSPKPLSYLWLQLDQNAFKEHSRALDSKLFLDSNEIKTHKIFNGGFDISEVSFIDEPNTVVRYLESDTRMQIFLAQPLLPGKKLKIKIEYNFKIPQYFYNADFNVNRTDILPTKNGSIYSIAQWYPRLCVLDDVEGWNTLPYLGNGEFYLEYGDFNVNLTLPSDYIVEASGALLNPEEVMTQVALKRWKEAHNSETKVFIRKADEVTNRSSRPDKKFCTWKFKIENARDFAWTASKSFIWEGIKINLPDGKKAFGVSVYPPEANQQNGWEKSSEYIKFTIEHFSKKWYPYPYPSAVNVASNLDGMEYPGIVFCSSHGSGNNLWKVTKHELGHTWFPMIVGSNERKYAWMDEGFNTFIDNLADSAFNHGEFNGYADNALSPERYFVDSLPPVFTRPDVLESSSDVFITQYLKTAYLLRLLRDHIVGAERFDFAFRKYIHDWAIKHPTPWDFFRSINNSTGEDLTWFWKSMFLKNYQLDQAITRVQYVNDTPNEGANIYISNLEKAAMPLIIQITTKSGKKIIEKLPVEIWEYSDKYVYRTKTTEPLISIVIDPEKIFPDANRKNNTWACPNHAG